MSEESVSLPVAQALASALAKIEVYVPTEYVDNSEPDIDAEHLNHAEQGIMRVTNLLNAAVDVIQGQESRLADAETKIGTAALTGGMTDLSSGVNSLYSNLGQSLYYKGEAVNTNNLETNGIYSLTPSTEMGTTGITANWGIVLCFGNPGYNHQNEWRWQRVFYTSTFRGGYRTKLNDGEWSSWSVL